MIPDEQQESGSTSSPVEVSPGKLLAAARQRAGLSQDEVATELYMTLTKVRSLENDDFARLHSDTFIRGYLRAYANLVKVDVNEVMAAYDKQAQRLGLVEVFVPKAVESSSKKIWVFVVFVGLVLVLLWLISVWFFDNKKEPDYPLPAALVVPQETLTVQQEMSLPVSSEEGSPADSAPEGDALVAPVSEVASEVGSVQNNAGSVAAVAPPPAQDIANHVDELIFEFAEECWLEVSDAQGDVLATQLEPAGSKIVIKGRAPFDVKLGNAQGVTIALNGKPVAFEPARGTNVRILKIGQ